MKKILLVDDSKALRTLVGRHLREQSWTVVEAEDGQECVMLALQHKPDLILLDVAMPHLDGPGALLKIRSKQSIRNTPVIMMTAASDRDTVVKLARLGIQDYIVKPFTIDLVLGKIYKIFARQAELAAEALAEGQGETPSGADDEPAEITGSHTAADTPASALPLTAQPADHPNRPNLLTVGLAPPLAESLRQGYSDRLDVYIAQNAEQAIQLLGTYPPHAVVLDLNATGFDVIEGYKRLKFLPALLQTPFLVIRHPDPALQVRAERVGIANFMATDSDADAVVRLFEVLEKERQSGHYGSNYVQTQQGVLILRWPEVIKLDKLKTLTYEVEDNLTRAAEQGHDRLVVSIGAIRQFHDGHLLLVLAVQRKAAALHMRLAFATQNEIARQFFQQYEDTREIVFHPSIEEGWQALA